MCPCPPPTMEQTGLGPCFGIARGRSREPGWGEFSPKVARPQRGRGEGVVVSWGGSGLEQTREAEAVGVVRKRERIHFFHFVP